MKSTRKSENIAKLIAEGKITQALEIADNNDLESLYELGVSYGQEGNHKVAEKIFRRITQLNPKDENAWLCKAVELMCLGKYKDSIKCFDQALKINPNDAVTWSNKGVALRALKKNEEAIKCYDQAIKIDQNFWRAWFNKRTLLLLLGKWDEAARCEKIAYELKKGQAVQAPIANEGGESQCSGIK